MAVAVSDEDRDRQRLRVVGHKPGDDDVYIAIPGHIGCACLLQKPARRHLCHNARGGELRRADP